MAPATLDGNILVPKRRGDVEIWELSAREITEKVRPRKSQR
jgi:hypothetical protein